MSAPTRINTGYVPHLLQRDFHQGMKRFNVLVCHRRWGKTVAAVNTLIDRALRFHQDHPDKHNGRFAYVAPLRKQAKDVAWDYFKLFLRDVDRVKFNESELRIDFPNGARITLYGADNYDAIRGLYLDGAVMDEVAQMKPGVWGEVVRPMLADRRGWILFIGTPKGINLFYDLYHDHLGDPDWYVRLYAITDTIQHLPWGESTQHRRDEVREARAEVSEAQARQEWDCDFNASSDDTLITIDLITPARGKHLEVTQYDFAAKVIGVDVARFGDDRSSIIVRQGLWCHEPKIFRGMNNMRLADQVVEAINAHEPDAVFIDGGRGEGVIDRCRDLGYDVIEVKFGGTPTDEAYRNKRSEMWHGVKKWLEGGGALPPNQELCADLVVPTYDYDDAGRMRLEAKKLMKKRIGRSPDVGDALALTFAQKVRGKTGRDMRRSNNRRAFTNNEYSILG